MAQSHSHAAEAYRILFVIEPSTLAESTAESVTRRLHQTGVANHAYGTATSLAQLESLLPLHAWDLILCHFGHLPSDIADLLQVARRLRPQTPVFVVGAQVTNREAFELGRLGAQEFIDASDTEQLLACIRQALTARPIGVPPNDGVRLAAQDSPVDPLEQILDSMQDAIMAISLRDHRLIYRSASFEHVFGYPVARFVDDPSFFTQVVPPGEVEMVTAARKNALRDGFVELEHRIIFPDGQVHWLHRRAYVVYDAEGQPVQVIDTARDITASKGAQEQLVAANRKQLAILASMPDLMFHIRADGTILDAHGHSGEIVVPLEVLLGKNVRDFIDSPLVPTDIVKKTDDAIQTVRVLGGPTIFEYTLPDQHHYEARMVPIAGSDELIIIARDITERKQFEARLRESEEKYRSLLESSDAVIVMFDAQGTVLYANDMAARPFGLTAQQMLGMHHSELFPPEIAEAHVADIRSVISSARGTVREALSNVAGEERWFRTSIQPVRGPTGTVNAVLINATDITASKTAEAKVRRSAENLLQQKSFLEILLAVSSRLITTPADRLDSVLQTTLAEVGMFLHADRTYIFAYDFVRMTVTTTHEWCAPGIEPQIQSVQALPLAGLEQWAARHKSGRTVQIHNVEALAAEDGLRKILEMQSVQSLLAIPLMEDGECTGFVGLDAVRAPRTYDESDQQLLQLLAQLIVNVRGRTNTLKALAASEAYLRSLVNSQTAFNVRVDMQGNISYCNERYRGQFASVGSAIIGTSSLESVHPEDRHKVYDAVAECFADAGKIVQLEIRKGTEQSGYIWTLWEFSAVTAGDESIQEIQCVGFDISRQKQAEAALQEANLLLEQRIRERTAELQGERNLLRTVIEAMSEGLVVQDKDGAIQLRNAAAQRILGLTSDQMIGRTSVDPRWRAVREDGTPYPGDLHPAMVTLRTGAPQDSVVMGVHKVDDSLTWILINSQPLADATDPQHYAVVATFTDITALKEAEAASKAALARERELGELKSRFLSMASHEFRNPLAGILTTTETLALLWERLDKAKIEVRLDRIRDQVLRLTAITDDVLHLTRLQTGRSKLAAAPGDLDEVVASVVGDLAELPGNQGRIHYDCAQRPVPAVFDARLLQQAIGNLLHNALKYSPTNKRVRVTLAHADKGIAREITLYIADEGIGIPPEDLPHLFEPFHRAANVGEIQGTGLGLAIAKEAVELHGGTIAVDSLVGVGTTFVISLPGSTQPA